MLPVWTYYVLCVIPVFSYMIIYDSPSTWSWSMININVNPSLIYEHSQPSTNTMSTQCIQLVEHSPNNPPHRTPCPSSYSFLYPKFAPPATGGIWGLRYSSYQCQRDWSYFESCLCIQTHTHTHCHDQTFSHDRSHDRFPRDPSPDEHLAIKNFVSSHKPYCPSKVQLETLSRFRSYAQHTFPLVMSMAEDPYHADPYRSYSRLCPFFYVSS